MSVTLGDIKQRVRDLVDAESADFVENAEIIRYINEGIKRCEAEIHKLNEDYYKKDASLSLVSGTSEYSLPSDIYAQKIRRIMYNNSEDKKYEVLPMKDEDVPFVASTDVYFRYRLVFNSSDAKVIKVYPAPAETNTYITISYIKQAAQLSSDSDVCDVPEFAQFVVDFARYRILQKEISNPMLETVMGDLAYSRKAMVETLQQSVPDGNNEIELGDGIYNDFYYNNGNGSY